MSDSAQYAYRILSLFYLVCLSYVSTALFNLPSLTVPAQRYPDQERRCPFLCSNPIANITEPVRGSIDYVVAALGISTAAMALAA